ncbi:MAG: Holliday junction resolvase Hjc [Desulfurococcaceae archaeon]
MRAPRSRGFQHERDLARRLWEKGLAVVRAPASGSKARRLVYPDLVAIYRGRVVAIEAKTTRRGGAIYVRREQVEKLMEFARRAGGEAYVAIKHVGTGDWRFVRIDSLVEAGNSFKVTREAIEGSPRLEELVDEIKGARPLTEFLGGKREGGPSRAGASPP